MLDMGLFHFFSTSCHNYMSETFHSSDRDSITNNDHFDTFDPYIEKNCQEELQQLSVIEISELTHTFLASFGGRSHMRGTEIKAKGQVKAAPCSC